MSTAAGALRLPPELRTRAGPKSVHPFRKRGRHRERRRRAWRFLLPARLLRAPGQNAATPSRARRPFESRRQSRRTARKDQAAGRARAGREFEAVRSWLCGAISIRQVGFGFGQGGIANWVEEGAPTGSGRHYNENKSTGLKTRHYKCSQSPIIMRLQKCLQNAQIGIWRRT